jgi:hypothetical protein
VSGNHEVGLNEPAARGHEPTDEPRGDAKGGIGDDSEWTAGEPEVASVRQHDGDAGVLETISEVTGACVVQLDCDDASSGADQRHGESTVAGTDIEHEVIGSDSGVLHEERRPTAIELVEAPPLLLSPGHGGP